MISQNIRQERLNFQKGEMLLHNLLDQSKKILNVLWMVLKYVMFDSEQAKQYVLSELAL